MCKAVQSEDNTEVKKRSNNENKREAAIEFVCVCAHFVRMYVRAFSYIGTPPKKPNSRCYPPFFGGGKAGGNLTKQDGGEAARVQRSALERRLRKREH